MMTNHPQPSPLGHSGEEVGEWVSGELGINRGGVDSKRFLRYEHRITWRLPVTFGGSEACTQSGDGM
jgi:hypothetical protein